MDRRERVGDGYGHECNLGRNCKETTWLRSHTFSAKDVRSNRHSAQYGELVSWSAFSTLSRKAVRPLVKYRDASPDDTTAVLAYLSIETSFGLTLVAVLRS